MGDKEKAGADQGLAAAPALGTTKTSSGKQSRGPKEPREQASFQLGGGAREKKGRPIPGSRLRLHLTSEVGHQGRGPLRAVGRRGAAEASTVASPAAVRPGRACRCLLFSMKLGHLHRHTALQKDRGASSGTEEERPTASRPPPCDQGGAHFHAALGCVHHLRPPPGPPLGTAPGARPPRLPGGRLQVSEPQDDTREVRRSSLHSRGDPCDNLSPPGFSVTSAEPRHGGRERQTQEPLSCPPPRVPSMLPLFSKLSTPIRPRLALSSCFQPGAQHRPVSSPPWWEPSVHSASARTRRGSPHRVSHLGLAAPDNCQQLAGPKTQLRSPSWGRGSGCSSSQGGHSSCNSFQAPRRPWDAQAGTWDHRTPCRGQKLHGGTLFWAQGPETNLKGPAPPQAPWPHQGAWLVAGQACSLALRSTLGPGPLWDRDRARRLGEGGPAQGQCGKECKEQQQQGQGHEGQSNSVSLRQQNGELGGGGGSGCSGERSPRLPLLPTIKQQFLPQPPR